MNNLWGTGQMSFSKMILAVDASMNIHDYSNVAKHLFNQIDLSQDLFFSEGILDVLDHSAPKALFGSKLGIDATGTEELKCDIPDIPSDKEILKFAKELSSDIRDISVPIRNVKLPMLFVSLEKKKPHAIEKIAKLIFSDSSLTCFQIVIFFDSDVDVENTSYSTWKFFNNVDPRRDFHFIDKKLSIDSTRKWKEEGYDRDWPEEIEMSRSVKREIDDIWDRLGI
jgi:4-hydroxy-3-polyprenylbenzoate decarboxylase